MTWEKQEPWEGPIAQGCLSCPSVERTALMNMVIGVGFGIAQVTMDNDIIFSETRDIEAEDLPIVADIEKLAEQDPDHDWRILLEAPLRSREYQRHGPKNWVLIHSGRGFA